MKATTDPVTLAAEAVEEARADLRMAQQNFDFAAPEYFEAANAALTAAEEKYKAANAELARVTGRSA